MIFFKTKIKKQTEVRKELEIPTYTLGKKKRQKISFTKKLIIVLVTMLVLAIYGPPLFIEMPDTSLHGSLSAIKNPAAMEEAITYLRNNLNSDFDGDGLTNEAESNYGTGVYMIDNDGDGVTDYAELYITETNPKVYDDAIVKYIINQDMKTGSQVNTPFKLYDILMWADDYESKAKGSVIEIYDGCYRFSNFNGWVQFPGNVFVYQIKNGYQSPVKQNEQGYYQINSLKNNVDVRVYSYELESCYVVNLLGNDFKISDNIFGKIINFILPNSGFGLITCRTATTLDLDGSQDEKVFVNDIIKYTAPKLDSSRFESTHTELTNLTEILYNLKEGNNVLISLMSHTDGESIVSVYGYTNRNNLIVCNPETGEALGVLNIQIESRRLLDQSGTINQYEYFEFIGCGYSSFSRHRIAILDYITPDGYTLSSPLPIPEPEPEPLPEPEPIVTASELRIINEIFELIEGEEDSFFEGDGKFQKTFNEIERVAVDEFIDILVNEYNYNYYFEDASVEEALFIAIADVEGNIIMIKYEHETSQFIVRLEAKDAEKTIVLSEEFFIRTDESKLETED